MKLFKSIKWRLQIWYGLILVAVLVVFEFSAYQLECNGQFRRIDDELHRRIGVLANALRRPPPHRPDAGEQPFDRPPPAQFSGDGPPEENLRRPGEFVLPLQDAHFFNTSDPNRFYFSIRSRDGKEIAHSTNRPALSFHVKVSRIQAVNNLAPPFPSPKLLGNFPKSPEVISYKYFRENYREMLEHLPSGEEIQVGCSLCF